METNTRPLLNSVISNDLEWLGKIFNDMKRRAVSLRQLSFLFTFIFAVLLRFCSFFSLDCLFTPAGTAFTYRWTFRWSGLHHAHRFIVWFVFRSNFCLIPRSRLSWHLDGDLRWHIVDPPLVVQHFDVKPMCCKIASTDLPCADYIMLSQDVCPSVRLPHAGIEPERLNISSHLFNLQVATPFWFFTYQTLWQYSDGDPATGASNAGGIKIVIFD